MNVLELASIALAAFTLYPTIYQIFFYVCSRRFNESALRRREESAARLSIVVPVKRESPSMVEQLVNHLESALRGFSGKVKVFVIADGYDLNECSKLTDLTLRSYAHIDLTVECRSSSSRNKAEALNYAVRKYLNDGTTHIMVLDVDSRLDGDLARTLSLDYDIVVPRWRGYTTVKSKLGVGQIVGYNYFSKLFKGMFVRLGWAPVVGSGTIVRLEALKRMGCFSDVILEDVDLGVKALLGRARVAYYPNLVVSVEVPFSYTAFSSQQCRWIYGCAELVRRYAKMFLDARIMFAVLPYLMQYFSYITQLMLYYILAIGVMLNIPLSVMTFTIISALYCSVLPAYMIILVSSRDDVPLRDALTGLSRVNLAYLIMTLRALVSAARGLLGLKYEWIPTPKVLHEERSKSVKSLRLEIAHAVLTNLLFAASMACLVLYSQSCITNVLLSLPYVVGVNWSLLRLLSSGMR